VGTIAKFSTVLYLFHNSDGASLNFTLLRVAFVVIIANQFPRQSSENSRYDKPRKQLNHNCFKNPKTGVTWVGTDEPNEYKPIRSARCISGKHTLLSALTRHCTNSLFGIWGANLKILEKDHTLPSGVGFYMLASIMGC
jgi:hypothetical protein